MHYNGHYHMYGRLVAKQFNAELKKITESAIHPFVKNGMISVDEELVDTIDELMQEKIDKELLKKSNINKILMPPSEKIRPSPLLYQDSNLGILAIVVISRAKRPTQEDCGMIQQQQF